MQLSTFEDILNIGLTAGLILMFAGYYYRTRIRHAVVMSGHVIYAIYWGFWTALYIWVEDNPSNAIFTIMGICVFGYLAYHEYENYRKNEYIEAMEWAARGTAITAFTYMIIERFHQVGGAIVYATAWQTAKIMNLIRFEPAGFPVRLGSLMEGIEGPEVQLIGSGTPALTPDISIILACTGVQAMILFLIFNLLLRAEPKRKLYGFLMTVPVIYVANQFRNLAIVYLSSKEITLGLDRTPLFEDAFDVAHNGLGKFFSFLVLIGIVIYTFRVLPEALDHLFTLMDLRKRDEGKIVDGKLVLPPSKKGKKGKKNEEAVEDEGKDDRVEGKGGGKPGSADGNGLIEGNERDEDERTDNQGGQ